MSGQGQLRIVLVEPREAGNVGAAARVMKNFGFRSLTIVGNHPELFPVAGWWASGSDDVLETARFVPTLAEAIGDAHLTIATTSMRGRTEAPPMTAASAATRYGALREEQTLALVFGREDSGLTHEEVMLCQYTAAISTDPAFPTMNLAQAVGAFCFALSMVTPAPSPDRELAPAALVERMHSRFRELLLRVGFLHKGNPDAAYDELRRMASRADLDAREVTILLGIVRQMEWALNKKAGE